MMMERESYEKLYLMSHVLDGGLWLSSKPRSHTTVSSEEAKIIWDTIRIKNY